MEKFIKDNISKINKNNILSISIGKKIDDDIFDKRLNKIDIDNFIQELSGKLLSKNCVFRYYSNKIYKYENNKIVIDKNNTYYSYKENITELVRKNYRDLSLSIVEITNNLTGPVSMYKYDSIENKDIFNIDFNLFNIEISKYDNYFTFTIIIKKPNSFVKILPKINEIIEIFM